MFCIDIKQTIEKKTLKKVAETLKYSAATMLLYIFSNQAKNEKKDKNCKNLTDTYNRYLPILKCLTDI